MGDVYQATDSKLGRSVAIKVLPPAFVSDDDRAARFEREARVLASLNHANIAAIYGFEKIADQHFLVMELVPGETLADRIQRGPIPVEILMEPSLMFGNPVALPIKGFFQRTGNWRDYDITPDGKQFLVMLPPGSHTSEAPQVPQIQVVLNWFEELKQRMAGGNSNR